MNTISVNYDLILIWEFREHPHYQFTKDRKCFNTQRRTQVKCVMNGGSVGFWISGKFYPSSKINSHLDRIVHKKLPF